MAEICREARKARRRGQPDDYDDLVQEGALAVWLRLLKTGECEPWQASVVARDAMTALARRSMAAKRSYVRERPADESDAATTVRDLGCKLDLDDAVSTLGETHQQILLMADRDDMSASEIAGQIGKNPDSTKAMLTRIRNVVRERLGDGYADYSRKHPRRYTKQVETELQWRRRYA